MQTDGTGMKVADVSIYTSMPLFLIQTILTQKWLLCFFALYAFQYKLKEMGHVTMEPIVDIIS